jgi:hypothetical protein
MTRYGWTRSALGVTLTEIMMAIATSGMLLAAIVSSFISQQKSYLVQTQIAEMTVNARIALDRLTRDIRLAGYGLPANDWVDWIERIDWVRGKNGDPMRFTNPVEITSNGTQLMLIGAFDRPFGYLTAGVPENTTRLKINYEDGASRPKPHKHNMIYIGRNEPALVTGTRKGRRHNDIDIDTNPDQPGNQGVHWAYPPDRLLNTVELITVLTYKIVIDKGNGGTPTPVLKRDTNTGGGAQPLAEYIENLRFESIGDTALQISLTARTANPDPNYLHPQKKDRYRRLTLTSHVKLRGIRS